LIVDGAHSEAKGRRLFKAGDIKKAKKNIAHGLRYLNYAKQLAETGKIFDITTGNEHFHEVRYRTVEYLMRVVVDEQSKYKLGRLRKQI
jgi:hypothetical protein